ncbi:MAG TPA: M81 family metallopeptidase [Chloroflexota bacterium]|nr:M81 family metallopeptidase [Chloroflexota bacterium]
MSSPHRIAVGGIRHETNTFSTLRTRLEDFAVDRGDAVGITCEGAEVVGTLFANAFPHGVVERRGYETLKAELLERLRAALPLDGVYLKLHGAMEVEEIGDGDGDLASAVRGLVGPGVPIAASLDLHGNVSQRLVEACDVLTALRTAPHRDIRETQERALRLLCGCLDEGRRPAMAMVKPPILIAGESAVTDVEPARSLYADLADIERRPGVMDASIMIGCAWADTARTSTAAIVVAWDRETAEREARLLGERIWERRREFCPDAETAPLGQAVARALAAQEGPVFVSDSGDNVTAGGAGDLSLVLEELLRAGARRTLVGGLADAAAVERCHAAGVGAVVELALGGKLDTVNGRPLLVEGTVRHLAPGLARLGCGGVEVIVAADRRAFTTPSGFAAAGADAQSYKVVVVKQGYLFPELRPIAARSILALTPGFTDLDLPRLPYRRVARPIYPLDPEAAWRP